MRRFNEWVKIREGSALDIGRSDIGDASLSNTEEGQLSDLHKAMQLSWARYRSETRSFLARMAAKDPEIQELVTRIEQEGEGGLNRAARKVDRPGHEKPVVALPTADGDGGPDSEMQGTGGY